MSRMTWKELRDVINARGQSDPLSLQDSVTVYDAAVGEYYPADLINFEESDGIIDAGTMFVSINIVGDFFPTGWTRPPRGAIQ